MDRTRSLVLAILLALIIEAASPGQLLNAQVSAQNVPPVPALTSVSRVPLSFEANQGQVPAPEVKYPSHGQQHSIALTTGGAILKLSPAKKTPELRRPARQALTRLAGGHDSSAGSADVFRLRLLGAERDPKISAEQPLKGRVNYLIGKDASQWRTKLPTYGKVRYSGVYPGIDLFTTAIRGVRIYSPVVAPGGVTS